MANKINQLPDASLPLSGFESLWLEQDGVNVQANQKQFLNFPIMAYTVQHTLNFNDRNAVIFTNSEIIVPAHATFGITLGARFYVINDSAGNITLTQASGVTMYLSGTATTGNRTLAQRGVALLWKLKTNEWRAINLGGLT